MAAMASLPPRRSEALDPAMRWDRDFDLLLEMEAVPTLAERKLALQRKTLLSERRSKTKELRDLKNRLTAITGSFSSSDVLREMLRQKVDNMDSARTNLKREIRETVRRIEEIDKALKWLPARAKPLKE